MRLPPATAHYSHRVRFGRYVARRLRRAGHTALAQDAQTATNAVRDAGRAEEDAADPVQEALADRDGADDTLDDIAKDSRAQLAGRSAQAIRQKPYTEIFPDGIDYFTAAPLSEEEKRYDLLIKRFEAHLPADDGMRANAVPAIQAGIAEFKSASTTLDQARNQAALAAGKLDAMSEAWERQMEKTYGVLLAEQGKVTAERFFPRAKSTRNGSPAEGDATA